MTEYFLIGTKKFVLDTPPSTLPTGDYAYINHDDIARDEKGQRIRAPEVYPLYRVEYTTLTETWQWFWFRVGLVHPYTGYEHWDENRLTKAELVRLKSEWHSLTHSAKAFTNNQQTSELRDYINRENLSGTAMKQGAITCCGNIVKVVGKPTNRGTPIETLDGTKPPPSPDLVNRITTPWLVFPAVNIPGYKENNKEFPYYVMSSGIRRVKADPFPNIWGIPTRGSDDTLVPLRSNANKTGVRYERDGVHLTHNWITSSRLVPISGAVPSPYVQED